LRPNDDRDIEKSYHSLQINRSLRERMNNTAKRYSPFFSGRIPRKKYEGTGIGLAIARKIIEKPNGIITASSVEQQGSVFTIILLLVQVEDGTVPIKRKA
jgi:nitrogen-specific signal transduction histidine kinase